MDLKQIKQIIELMKRSELTEFAVEEEGFKLKIKRTSNEFPLVTATRGSAPIYAIPESAASPNIAGPASAGSGAGALAAPAEEAGITYIKSPMVGTFYRAPTPESKPFLEPGTQVAETSVACIIEAMKIMNEIQAETKGTVIEVLAENGQPVEYGQRLFKVKQG